MNTAPNTLFPGRPDYVGPTEGLFGLLHHTILYEDSHDVMERVEYVKKKKPRHEVATRLHNMIYLPVEFAAKRDALYADYYAKRAALDADYHAKRDALYADDNAKRAAIDADDNAKLAALNDDYNAKRAPIDADYLAKRDALDADYLAKRVALTADYSAKRAALNAEILAYIRRHIPDCAWDETKKTLIFPAS